MLTPDFDLTTNVEIFVKVQKCVFLVSSDLGELNRFYSRFLEGGQKAHFLLKV